LSFWRGRENTKRTNLETQKKKAPYKSASLSLEPAEIKERHFGGKNEELYVSVFGLSGEYVSVFGLSGE